MAQGTEVCPACHRKLAADVAQAKDVERWCDSCGSPVPADADACPVCGLPVKGAFEDSGTRFTVKTLPTRKRAAASTIVSAIPPEPKVSEAEELAEERPRRLRLVVVAALAALLLVGGTTLYIARPWDPDAYTIHAMEDADTSMEGFPGERSHLVSQDKTQEAELQAARDDARAQMEQRHTRLAELAATLDESHAALDDYLERGYLFEDEKRGADVVGVANELDEMRAALEAADYDDADLAKRRDDQLVLVGYLRSATQVLSDAWSAANQKQTETDAVFEVRSILEGSLGREGYDVWYQLFQNAYAA